MNKIYDRLNHTSFKMLAIVLLIICDATFFTYLYKVFSNKKLFNQVVDLMVNAMPDARQNLPPDFKGPLYTLMINALIFFLAAAFLYHLLVYFLWHKKINAGRAYVVFYTWVAGPFFILAALTSFKEPLISLYYMALGITFLFVAMGTKIFKEKKKPKLKNQGQ